MAREGDIRVSGVTNDVAERALHARVGVGEELGCHGFGGEMAAAAAVAAARECALAQQCEPRHRAPLFLSQTRQRWVIFQLMFPRGTHHDSVQTFPQLLASRACSSDYQRESCRLRYRCEGEESERGRERKREREREREYAHEWNHQKGNDGTNQAQCVHVCICLLVLVYCDYAKKEHTCRLIGRVQANERAMNNMTGM